MDNYFELGFLAEILGIDKEAAQDFFSLMKNAPSKSSFSIAERKKTFLSPEARQASMLRGQKRKFVKTEKRISRFAGKEKLPQSTVEKSKSYEKFQKSESGRSFKAEKRPSEQARKFSLKRKLNPKSTKSIKISGKTKFGLGAAAAGIGLLAGAKLMSGKKKKEPEQTGYYYG